ncbi:hypothetical protein RB195_015739 [Necator americanus]|uniref:Uncharacterized protein n=1 Tax=Necator americanus TaxID=51031 RepID=A0ABR1E5Y4_NECAM
MVLSDSHHKNGFRKITTSFSRLDYSQENKVDMNWKYKETKQASQTSDKQQKKNVRCKGMWCSRGALESFRHNIENFTELRHPYF